MSVCEDELLCDFAEVYHIYDLNAFSVEYLGILARGLRANSRVMMKLNGDKIDIKDTLLSLIVDNLQTLVWFKTSDGQHNRNRPASIYKQLTGNEPQEEYAEFKTGEDFKKAWNNG